MMISEKAVTENRRLPSSSMVPRYIEYHKASVWDDKLLLAALAGVIAACLIAYWLMGGGFFGSTLR